MSKNKNMLGHYLNELEVSNNEIKYPSGNEFKDLSKIVKNTIIKNFVLNELIKENEKDIKKLTIRITNLAKRVKTLENKNRRLKE
ncbi:MAG: hypothetical protein Unbinned1693contig1002_31 [Prokaryotic dsDNA virus sp.]|jgi:hypothetical protein|nr:MAG: hypothetical protein Unbinned1693contig1002_31 [Prokaryotic dsDNA virus sp.]|tara:strand:+ start:6125 stop:6379 length:255 start_codon:yes stop_codon:yes gene_type:complete